MQSQLWAGMVKALMDTYYAIDDRLGAGSACDIFGRDHGDRCLWRVGRGGHWTAWPLFIPFLLVDKLSFLFWGWLRAFIGFSFYKVVAAAVLSILGHLYQLFYMSLIPLEPVTLITKLPLLMLLVLVNIYLLFKIPAITASIFSGHTGGQGGGGLGLVALASRFV